MRNLKKLVALIVTIAMIATFAIPAFAAPADVVGTAYEGAVTRLTALGVIKGYPNGNFGPNDTITRAQFAAVVVRALGFESLAATAAGVTKFSDVPATYWGAGYINIAVSLGLINGYGNGKFGPDDKVTFDQAVTIIVRALGQDAYAKAKGGFPTGYLLQGQAIGFTSGVVGVAGVPTTRGVVAQLIDNAKEKPIYIQTGFGDSQTYEPTGGTFLSKLGMTKLEGKIVTKTPASAGLTANTFVASGVTYTAVAGAFDIEALLGKKVNLWTNGTAIVLSEVVSGTAVAVSTINTYNADTNVVTVTLADGTAATYTADANAGAFRENKATDVDTAFAGVAGTSADMLQASFVVDGTTLLLANVVKFTSVIKLGSAPVENKVSKFIRLFTDFYIKYGDVAAAKVVIVKDGVVVDWTALAAGDVLFVAGSGDITPADNYIVIKATNKTVTGTLQAAKPLAGAATTIKVDGTWYTLAATAVADVADELGSKVTLTLDPAGKVYGWVLVTAAAVSADKYGVVQASDITDATALEDAVYKVKLFTADGTSVIYTVANNADTAAYIAGFETPAVVNDLVSYHIAANGTIDKITDANTDADGATSNLNKVRMTFDSKNVSSNVVLFKNTAGVYSKIALTDIVDNAGNEVALSYISEGGTIVAMVLPNGGYTTVSTAGSLSYVTDYTAIAGGYTIDMLSTAGAKSYDNAALIAKGSVITYTLDASNKMTGVAAEVADDVGGVVSSVDSTKIVIDGATYWFTDSSLIIFDAGADGTGASVLTKADLYTDMVVNVYTNATDDVVALVVTAM